MIILDGAMGTLLQKSGMKAGERSEIFGFNNPEILKSIHERYVQAGANVIYADTFAANRRKLKGTGYSVSEVIKNNVAIAKEAGVRVALDIGPIGDLIEPLGTLSMDEAYDIYKEMIIAGVGAGADLIVFETQMSLAEVRMGVLAAKENSSLPIWVTMTFGENGKTFTGTDIQSFAMTMEALGVDAVGINCSLGPKEIVDFVAEIAHWTNLPIIAKPNAGLPDPVTGNYDMNVDDFAFYMRKLSEAGAEYIGGCCGTNPDYIKSISSIAAKSRQNIAIKLGCCSSGRAIQFKNINVVGERINPTGKKTLQAALKEGNMDYVLKSAIEQEDAGADILDINVGTPGIDESDTMKKVVLSVQNVVNCPLQIDSASLNALEQGLRYFNGVAIVNSVNGDDEKLDSILPIVKKYGAAIIGLTMDKNGIPRTCEDRIAIAKKIYDRAIHYGIAKEKIIIDCLTLTVSAEQNQAQETLKALRYVKNEMKLHCTLGVSNISFGLPERENITETFLIAAMNSGLDFPIINPNSKRVMDAIYSYRVLNMEDKGSISYIDRFKNVHAEIKNVPSDMTLEKAIISGLNDEVRNLTLELLKNMDAIDIVNERLIPALDIVGERYEKQEIYLPQLISAANAAGVGFNVIKDTFKTGEDTNKGTVLLATVKGDIHDIGKNIVKVVMENYGFKIIDLGRDVAPEKIVESAIGNNVRLVGLSALMTTTVDSMKETIKLLKDSQHNCYVMAGGAVLTEEFAKNIGADFYVKDAMDSVNVARKIFGDKK